MTNLVPGPDPLGLPAPVWLLVTLLVVTHALHMVFMNFALAGSWVLCALMVGRESEWKKMLYERMMAVLPVAISLAITFGIAPLLFVQVLYGQFFYVANVLLGFFWLAILALLMVGFYTVYVLKARRPEGGEKRIAARPLRLLLHLGVASAFTAIAFLFTTNAALSQHPELWPLARAGSPVGSVWREAGLAVPRFLHNLVGSFGIGGLWLVWIALFRGSDEEAEKGARLGAMVSLVATAIQMVIGFWYLLSLPEGVLKRFLTFATPGSFSLILGILLAVGLFLALFFLSQAPSHARLRWIASALAAAVLLLMSATNEALREELLREHFTLPEWTVRTQWGPILVFLAVFVAGLAVVAWLARVAWRAHNPRGAEPSS
ncbi:MAG: hypothetical protein HUU16_01055 [Candidatus Omnitrophica bacterium]|nr:hypothetical protein [Candidatus Omnitrophota bacterium]